METVFLKLVNMSITAGWLALAVMAVRLLFRRMPRWITCLLWGLVALRLICPFTLESALSLIPSAQPLPQEILYTARPEIHSGLAALDEVVNPMLEASLTPVEPASANPTQILSFVCSRIWVVGMGMMLLYTLVSFLLLKRRVCTAIPLEKGVKQSEFVDSPFVLGVFRPVIYLPFGLEEGDRTYVLAHERAHIRRHDHWWKPAGFFLLTVYWFNPVMWAAYILLCRDIEAACDEKVIRNMRPDDRRAYSTALLNCSVHRRRIAACPVAFGEVGVKARIRNVMNYKKPAFWVILAALLISTVVAVCFLTDPKQSDSVYDRTSTLALEDVGSAQAMLWESGQEASFLLTEDQTRELVSILNTMEKSEFKNGDSGPKEKSVRLVLEGGELLLTWDGAGVRFDGGEESAWVCNAGLNRFFDGMKFPDWGVTVQSVEASPEKATIQFFRNASSLEGSLCFDGEYRLQTWTDSGWREVPVRDADSGFPATENQIPPNSTFGQTIYWEDRYSELSPGDYRIVKYLRLRRDSGFVEYCPYYGEFSMGASGQDTSSPAGIVCVDICYQKCFACLSLESEYEPIVSMLTQIQANARTVPEAEVPDRVMRSGHTHFIQLNSSESQQTFVLSQDGSLLWTEEEDRRIYSLEDFPQLVAYLLRMTEGVRRVETDGTPFATKDQPWNWTKQISASQVEQASIYLLHETERDGNSTSQSISDGTFSAERFSQMLEILNAIPKEAFLEESLPLGAADTYATLRIQLFGRGISVSILDRVNSLAVVFRYYGTVVEMAMCDDMEKIEDDSLYLKDSVTCWKISDPALTQYMQSLMEDPPIVNYLVGSGFEWTEPVEFAYGDFALTLQMIEGWECRTVEGTPGARSFGVRCRPEGTADGWLYFSFWPGGYEPREENRWYGEGSWMGYPSVRSYPDQVLTDSLDAREAVWSYYRVRTGSGDFAIINQGADAWFPEYREAIDAVISLCGFSVTIQSW